MEQSKIKIEPNEYLKQKSFYGLEKKGLADKAEYIERLEEELDVITECGLSEFMLNTAYTVLLCKSKGVPVGPGRGCLKNDTQVFTQNGFKNIEDLKEGEMVLSSDAKYHKILSVQKYDNDELLTKIKTHFGNDNELVCTKDHKILVSRAKYADRYLKAIENNWKSKKIRKFSKDVNPPIFIEASEVQKDDLLVIPKQKKIEENKIIDLAEYCDLWCDVKEDTIIEYTVKNFSGGRKKIDLNIDPIPEEKKETLKSVEYPRYISINYDFGYFLGVFSGDGWLERKSRTTIGLCCNIEEDNENYIPKIINNLGFDNFYKYINKESHVIQYIFRSRVFVSLLKSLVPMYNYEADTKELYGYLLSNDSKFLRGLVDGIVKSDGGIRKNQIFVDSSSLKLIQNLRYILFKLNVPNSFGKRDRTKSGFNGSKDFIYNITFNKMFLQGDFSSSNILKEDKNNFYLRVRENKEIQKKEDYVYDISVEDSYNFLTSNGIVHNSVGGSLVAYCIGITEVDPIKYNLSFARFLNKARMKTQIADIDLDVARKNRPDVIKLMREKFGEDKTSQIINDVYFTDKTAIQNLGRIFGVPFQKRNKITALIGEGNAENIPEVQEFFDEYPQIKRFFPKLKGLISHSSIHAGGLLVSDKSMTDYISTENVRGNIVTCYNGKVCEKLGFLKMDALGLNTLSIIKDCLSFIGKNNFDFNYNLDDPKVYETINKSTLGIFQLEGRGASEYTSKLKPQNFNDIIADLALVRPGAQDSGDAEEFLEIRAGNKEVHYDHPLLKDILEETNGCILYQEQAMEISRVLSGFTDVEADLLRRGISKKLTYVFDEYKPKFIDGAVNNGVDKDIAEKIWNRIEKSSSYSFNKSHSVGYSLVTYQTAYLKTYYPMEYYTAMLNNVESEEKRNRIYNEIKSLNKNLINPDINNSGQICMYTDDNIYLSFPLINGVGPAALEAILAHQPYKSFDDFMNRKTSKVNKGVVKALIEAGAFDRFGDRRDDLYSIIEEKDCHWDDKETLFREFQRIKINPKNNLLDLYDTKEMGLKCDISSVHELQDNTEEYKDFYVKLLPSEFNKKDNYAFVSATDGFNNMSLFVGNEFLSRYIDSLNTMGEPLLCHVHGKGEKYSLVSLIKLNEPDKYKHEYWSYIGTSIKKVQELQNANPSIHVGFISNVNYFTSKNGNPCARYDITLGTGETLEGRITVHPPLMYQGSFIFFEIGDNPVFPNIIQVA